MGAGGFIARDEALGGHDLQELQDGGVGGFAVEVVVDGADGAGAVVPEDAEDGEFAVGGFGEVRHGFTAGKCALRKELRARIYEGVRRINEDLRRLGRKRDLGVKKWGRCVR